MQLGSGVAVAVLQVSATAAIRPLPWEPPYTAGVALKSKTKKRFGVLSSVPAMS